jgi:hypothetical protein
MHGAKLTFLQDEIDAMVNRKFFESKISASIKILGLLNQLQKRIESDISVMFPAEFRHHFMGTSKISRGENYLGYPYMMLDYPRVFDQEAAFSFRSMFWWGNHFSFFIYLAGNPAESFLGKLVNEDDLVRDPSFYFCINKNPWDHGFNHTNMVLLNGLESGLTEYKIIAKENGFIKIGRKLPITDLDKVIDFGLETYRKGAAVWK